MPRLSIMGHPVRSILQAIPAAVLPASTTFDELAYLSKESLSEAGRYILTFGLLGDVSAATTGIPDYYELENTPVRRGALYYGITNAALMASWRRLTGGRADREALLLSILGAPLIGLSEYLGGYLVDERGVRVGEDHDNIPGAN